MGAIVGFIITCGGNLKFEGLLVLQMICQLNRLIFGQAIVDFTKLVRKGDLTGSKAERWNIIKGLVKKFVPFISVQFILLYAFKVIDAANEDHIIRRQHEDIIILEIIHR